MVLRVTRLELYKFSVFQRLTFYTKTSCAYRPLCLDTFPLEIRLAPSLYSGLVLNFASSRSPSLTILYKIAYMAPLFLRHSSKFLSLPDTLYIYLMICLSFFFFQLEWKFHNHRDFVLFTATAQQESSAHTGRTRTIGANSRTQSFLGDVHTDGCAVKQASKMSLPEKG